MTPTARPPRAARGQAALPGRLHGRSSSLPRRSAQLLVPQGVRGQASQPAHCPSTLFLILTHPHPLPHPRTLRQVFWSMRDHTTHWAPGLCALSASSTSVSAMPVARGSTVTAPSPCMPGSRGRRRGAGASWGACMPGGRAGPGPGTWMGADVERMRVPCKGASAGAPAVLPLSPPPPRLFPPTTPYLQCASRPPLALTRAWPAARSLQVQQRKRAYDT